MAKPNIIVLSKDTDQDFLWLSDGWNEIKKQHTPKAKALFAKAEVCMEQGETVPEVIALLEKAGFAITRE